jgi:hypothetical protein
VAQRLATSSAKDNNLSGKVPEFYNKNICVDLSRDFKWHLYGEHRHLIVRGMQAQNEAAVAASRKLRPNLYVKIVLPCLARKCRLEVLEV